MKLRIDWQAFRERPVKSILETLIVAPIAIFAVLAEAIGYDGEAVQSFFQRKHRRFFEKAGPVLSEFAKQNNLKLEEWYRESYAWHLFLNRPNGRGIIQVQRSKEGVALIAGFWCGNQSKSKTASSSCSYVAIDQLAVTLAATLREIESKADQPE